MTQQPPEGQLTPHPPTMLPIAFLLTPEAVLQSIESFQFLGEQEHRLGKISLPLLDKAKHFGGSCPYLIPREAPVQAGAARTTTIYLGFPMHQLSAFREGRRLDCVPWLGLPQQCGQSDRER